MTEETVVTEEAESTEVGIYEPKYMNYMDGKEMNKIYKNAQVIASSDLIPDTYKNKPSNVMMAMDMASRGGFGLMMVMQNLYIVKGKPSWSGQFCIAAIKGCNKYTDVKYNYTSASVSDHNYGVYLSARDKATGEIVKGTTVDWAMVKAYGWDAKNGSQWISNPEQMFKYRAAAYFARSECPEVLLGLYTSDELKDVGKDNEPTGEKETITIEIDSEVVEDAK